MWRSISNSNLDTRYGTRISPDLQVIPRCSSSALCRVSVPSLFPTWFLTSLPLKFACVLSLVILINHSDCRPSIVRQSLNRPMRPRPHPEQLFDNPVVAERWMWLFLNLTPDAAPKIGVKFGVDPGSSDPLGSGGHPPWP